jgi:glyoxylase-like metal-dependent hydrolase (beta-lactamase superfamily II)
VLLAVSPHNWALHITAPGHTRDNIVVWLPRQRVLFGGCFLKSVTSADLGYLADAVVGDWAGSARRVSARYPARQITIPGHGIVTGDPVGHTLALLGKEPDKPSA